MAELARGTVFDRPWGRTLAALGLRGLTGQLTLMAEGKSYDIAFSNGAVIGAMSPIASDAAVRVALTGGLVSTTQVAELARKQAASPGRDEVDVISEHLRLAYDQSMRLRRRTVAQRAARTFSVEKGDFVVTDDIRLHTVAGSEMDVRAIIFLGAKQNLSEARLASELGMFGTWFRLKPESFEDLPQFGFTEAERPIIDQLLNGASLGELEEIIGLDPRVVRATLYSLCVANACNVEQTRGQSTKPPPVRHGTGSDPGVRRAGATSDPGLRRAAASDPGFRRAQTEPGATRRAQTEPGATRRAQTEPGATRREGAVSESGIRQGAVSESGVRRQASSQPPATQQPTQPPPRAKTPSAQPIVAYRPGIRHRPGSAPPANLTSTPVAPSTIPPATRSHPALDPNSNKTNPGFPRAKSEPGGTRTMTPTAVPVTASRTTTPTAAPRTTTPTAAPRTAAASSPPATKRLPGIEEVQQLIVARAKVLERGADHYELIGVPPTASGDVIRKTYFDLARQLHPDRLAALGIADDAHVAHKVFAQLNTAFAVLSDARRRSEYDELLGRGGESAMREDQAKAEELTMRIMQAEEAYKKGELALKRDDLATAIAELTRAVELNPDEPDFQAMHAWALFVASPDKHNVARQTRAQLEKAIQRSPRAINPRFFLGRVERMLGRDKEALDLFRDVLVDKPHHTDAQAEVRAIEQRLSNAPKPGGGGLFGRKR